MLKIIKMGSVNEIEQEQSTIKICSKEELIQIKINDWLHHATISYSLNNNIHKDTSGYFGVTKCCFCSNMYNAKNIINLFNAYHPHKCGMKHIFANRYPVANFLQRLFLFNITHCSR